MQEESLATLTTEERPRSDELEGYVRRFPLDEDLTMYRMEISDWFHDRRKRQESERDSEGRTPLPGHDDYQHKANTGFDPSTFNVEDVVRKVRSRPDH